MKAITTKFLGATNTKGSRYKADDGDGNTVTLPRNSKYTKYGNSRLATAALCSKMDWHGRLQFGTVLKSGHDFLTV